jgi:hypothetical protein
MIEFYEKTPSTGGQSQLALDSGVSQPSISRLKDRCPDRVGRAFEALFKYSSKWERGSTPVEPAGNQALMAALQSVWNGSDEHAHALAEMIRAAGHVAAAAGPRA